MSVRAQEARPSLLQIDAILSRLEGVDALHETCRFLTAAFPHYRWVGIYRVEGAELVLDAWDGPAPTEHVRIPIGQGVCGRAAREGTTVVVDDVREDPEYLACFVETRSEIVVPIRDGTRVLGEIDIDGTAVGAYDASDRAFLEEVAVRLARPLTGGGAGPPPPSGSERSSSEPPSTRLPHRPGGS